MVNLTKLQGVERTMLMPLWARWSESIKENGLLYDKKAIEIVKKIDFDFNSFDQSQHPLTKLAWITRAWNTDRELEKYQYTEPFTVIALGCGLDTAYYRNPSPNMKWIDVDLIHVIDLRKSLLEQDSKVTLIAGSILDESLYKQLKTDEPVIVLALGLLCYFTKEEVQKIIQNLTMISTKITVIMDYFSQAGIEVSNKIVVNSVENAKMIWYANTNEDLLSLSPNIEIIDNYPMFQKIMPNLKDPLKQYALMSDMKNINSIAVLEARYY